MERRCPAAPCGRRLPGERRRGRGGGARGDRRRTARGGPGHRPQRRPAGRARRRRARPDVRDARRRGRRRGAGPPGSVPARCGSTSSTRSRRTASLPCTAPRRTSASSATRWAAAWAGTVVGGPRSCKSTLLRTIVTSMSLITTPQESQFFVLDFGGTFAPLARPAPRRRCRHSRRARRRTPDPGRGPGVVDRREAYFRANGIDSIETYRSRRRGRPCRRRVRRRVPRRRRLGHPAADFDDLELELQQLATRGLTFGLHLVAGAARWADFRAAMRDLFGTRLELRLGDPMDSEIDRKSRRWCRRAARPRPGARTSCTSSPPYRARRVADVESLGEGVDDLVEAGGRGLDRRPPARSCGCCPSGSTLRRTRTAPSRRRGTGGSCSASTSWTSARSGWTPPPSRTCWSSATGSRARAACCAR